MVLPLQRLRNRIKRLRHLGIRQDQQNLIRAHPTCGAIILGFHPQQCGHWTASRRHDGLVEALCPSFCAQRDHADGADLADGRESLKRHAAKR